MLEDAFANPLSDASRTMSYALGTTGFGAPVAEFSKITLAAGVWSDAWTGPDSTLYWRTR